ncbi:hypothetical protein H0H92_013719, partial [Tricholoma furcatifolium]
RRRTPEFEPRSFFGQLDTILVVPLPATTNLELAEPTTLILAAVHSCTILAHNDLDVHYYKQLGRTEVVDVSSIQCLVRRIKVGNMWAIIDHSGSMAR